MTEEKAKKTWVQKLKDVWQMLTLIATIIGAVISTLVWVDSKFDEYEQRGVDLSEVKRLTVSLQEQQAATNDRLTESINVGREQVNQQFRLRDQESEELRAFIIAVRAEMRARHGVVPLAEGGSRRASVREAEENADEAALTSQRSERAPALEALGGL